MIRQATTADIPALIKLEQEAFGDSESFCRLIFEKFAGLENVWLDEAAEGLVAMALTVPVTLNKMQGAYLYALTTAKAHRRTGRMSAMLQQLKEVGAQKGWAFLCLIPADEPLALYYAARGFVPAFDRYTYQTNIPRNLLATAEFDDITVSMLPQLRRRYCHSPVLELSAASLAAVLTDYYTCGGSTARTPEAYGLYRVRDGALLFDELFAADDHAAMALLQACREKTRCEKAYIHTGAEFSNLFGKGRKAEQGMLCPLMQPAASMQGYMGMMMDD